MSLINDALKKAQKQRTEDNPSLNTMPGIGGEPAARIAKRAKPPGFSSLLLWTGLGAGTLVVLVVGGFFLVRFLTSRTETPPTVKPAVVAQTTSAPATESAPAKPAPSTPTGSYVLPAAPTPAAVQPTVETQPVVTAPVVPPPEPEAPKIAPVLKLEPKAVAYIEALRVSGIRASSTDGKVLMNDRVYRVGDTVEHQLGLKLAVITANALTFEDERGARYTRSF
jgi:hypothetical protein